MINLAQNPIESPEEFFTNCAKSCELLGITSKDIYGDFTKNSNESWLRRFEDEVSSYFGKPCAQFLPSGVMAQSIALKISQRSQPDNKYFVCHYSSHLLYHEKDGFRELLNMTPIVCPPSPDSNLINQVPMRYLDVKDALDFSDSKKPTMLLIEVPHREIGGKCTSWDDLVLISQHCRRNNIHFHMDGARLWEASASNAYEEHSLTELCDLFDSIYVSFYKGLAGVSGAMLVGSDSFIQESRVWSRRFGGNIYSLLPLAVSCWSGFRQRKDTFKIKLDKLKEICAVLTEKFKSENREKYLIRFDPPVPEVSMIHIYFNCSPEKLTQVHSKSSQATGIKCFNVARSSVNFPSESYIELNLNDLNLTIPTETWVKGWDALFQEMSSEFAT